MSKTNMEGDLLPPVREPSAAAAPTPETFEDAIARAAGGLLAAVKALKARLSEIEAQLVEGRAIKPLDTHGGIANNPPPTN